MEASDIKVTITATDLAGLMARLDEAERSAEAYRKMLEEEREAYNNYKRMGAEREENVRKAVFEEYQHRTKLLELNERKVRAYQDYHNIVGMCLNAIKAILEKRITKADRAAIEKEQKRISDAWETFDAVQKQIADELREETWNPCKLKMPPNTKDSICANCAEKEGSKQ